MTIHTIPEAVEVHFGTFEGRSVADIRSGPDGARFEAWENGDQVDGIESLDDASRRARRVFQQVLEADMPGPIVLVTHGLLIRMIVCACVLKIAPSVYRHFTIDNASITTIAITDRDIKLTGLNDTHFLQEPGTVWR
jgi:probable phosphoglycerate mutase